MKKLVIFDLDGTLLNTIDDLGQAANHALLKNDFPTHSIASYPFFVGNGVLKLPVNDTQEITQTLSRHRGTTRRLARPWSETRCGKQ